MKEVFHRATGQAFDAAGDLRVPVTIVRQTTSYDWTTLSETIISTEETTQGLFYQTNTAPNQPLSYSGVIDWRDRDTRIETNDYIRLPQGRFRVSSLTFYEFFYEVVLVL